MSDEENPTTPKQEHPHAPQTTGHVSVKHQQQVFLSKQAEDHATALQSELNHHFTHLHSNQRRKDPLELLVAKLLPGTSTAVLGDFTPQKLSPSKFLLNYSLNTYYNTMPCT